MCCLLAAMMFIGPRFASVVWWLFDPIRWAVPFTSWLIPILGIVFIPWTTLIYVLVFPGGVAGFDWLLLGVAFIMDISSYASSAYSGNKQYRR